MFKVGGTYQSVVGDHEYKVKVLFVGEKSAFVKVLSARVNSSMTVGEERIIHVCDNSNLYWKEYVEPVVETKHYWVTKFHGEISVHWNDRVGKKLGCIRVTVTNDELTSVDIIKN